MVSGCSASQSLASELVESNDGHEEIIKVSFVTSTFRPPSRLEGAKVALVGRGVNTVASPPI